MASIPVVVEHPQLTQRFIVDVVHSGSIRDLKERITESCPGNPKVDGQRLISKGRILADEEKVAEIWASSDEARVVHLAVNPLSWGTPVETPRPQVPDHLSPTLIRSLRQQVEELEYQSQRLHTATSSAYMNRNGAFATPQQFERPTIVRSSPSHLNSSHIRLPYFDKALPFIRRIHYKALRALSVSCPPPPYEEEDFAGSKEVSRSVMESRGLRWPPIFDVEFPSPSAGGVAYEFTLIGGKPFLQNLTPHETPTPRQQHALELLSYTFPLLSQFPVPFPPQAILNLQQQDQNVGLNNARNVLRVAAGINGQQRLDINLRAIMTPLILLSLRTLLLLYFFSPARKPLFGMLVGAYVLYEAWGALRGAINDGARRNGNDARNNNGQGAGGAPDGAGAQRGAGARRDGNPAREINAHLEAGVSYVARTNLSNEARWLENGGPEPSLFTKLRLFVSLFFMSLHPEFWNRRRAALRAREGALRTEANAREAALARQHAQNGEGEGDASQEDENARRSREELIARHARRPAWVREYIDRVRQGDWVDD